MGFDPRQRRADTAVELTADEVAYIKRPPSDDELKTTGLMPQRVADGWLIRKRCQEIAERRGNHRLADMFETIAQSLREK